MKIHSKTIPFNADLYTPVNLYLAVRNNYRKTCLLESNDYHSRQDSKSFIGLEPIVEIKQIDSKIQIFQKGETREVQLNSEASHSSQIQEILSSYEFNDDEFNGFFGRLGFEHSLHDETHISPSKSDLNLPSLHLFLFKYSIVIDHFTSEGFLIENNFSPTFEISALSQILKNNSTTSLPFELFGNEKSEFSDSEFEQLVQKGIEHCKRGDVFQLVLSNAFHQSFFGDDFEVYRTLRQLNPSPYLFYFDFEEYKLFGSSPEAQLILKKGKAEIHPIAGTVPKTGVEEFDAMQLQYLIDDEKENAEHTMLVDLARNDLSRDCTNVKVESYKEIQSFSHVSHLVSKVVGELRENKSFESLSHSFPAGTLSGTPKPRALELINQYEKTSRDFYGGAIGMIGSNGDLNMAIVIRSILSKNNNLHYRAGAGVVLDSNPQRETQEVHHKLAAVRKAIAQTQLNHSQIKKQQAL
ncbi:MAG: anthranilate synthase component 1 [Crocinitomicaceae bacterium]|jgi:anthranilate synthase component 1